MSFIPLLQAASTSTSGSMIQMLVTFGLIFAVMYFLIFRPQKKKEQETKRMIDALKKGDKVVTIGGIHGTISSTKERTVIVKVDDGTKIEFNRTAISTVVVDKPVENKKDEKKKDKEAKEEAAPAAETTTAETATEQPSESK